MSIKIEQIEVGMEIVYKDYYLSDRHTLWKFIAKIDYENIIIELHRDGVVERRMIDINKKRIEKVES
jgi:hypothetical protein